MSLPEFSTNSLSREDAVNQVISSIAMEELGLSHIINAEGEKLQYVLGTIPGVSGPAATIEDVLKVNESVRMVLQNAAESQSHLRNKLQNVLSSAVLTGPTGATGATGPIGPSSGLNAFGGLFNNSVGTFDLTANVPTIVTMPFMTAFKGVSYNIANSITVEEAGNYYVAYSTYARFNAPAALTFAVRINEANINAATNTVTVASSNYGVNHVGNTIVQIPANGVIDIAVTSSVDQTMTFIDESLITLNLFKLD